MAISFQCQCGRAIMLPDLLAGKVIRCPECQAELTVPAATPSAAYDAFAARAEESLVARPQRRVDLRDESLTRPTPVAAEGGGGFGTINGGVGGGILMMVVAVIWFGVGFALRWTFIYPPILFVIGLIAMIRGLMKGSDDA